VNSFGVAANRASEIQLAKVHGFRTILRFSVFLPIGLLLIAAFLLTDFRGLSMFIGHWRDPIHRWFLRGWQWVVGESHFEVAR